MVSTSDSKLIISPLLSKANLDSLPPRILCFRLRLSRFDYEITQISHVPGKLLYTADALSRAPIPSSDVTTIDKNIESSVNVLLSQLPASPDRLKEYQCAQQDDPTCSLVITYCKQGWPNRHRVRPECIVYWKVRNKLSIINNLLLFGNRIVIPEKLRTQTLQKIHYGHQGLQWCRQRVSSAVWWPGIAKHVESFIKSCPECMKTTPTPTQPLLQVPLPSYPWERIAADLFELKKTSYLLVVDYYSPFVEVQKLTSTTSSSIIVALKAIFSRHGIPSIFMSDNGPQFDSKEMEQFAKSYCFQHITSSTHYHQSNGLAERIVKTVKSLLRFAEDPYLALLCYRSTPLLWCGLRPSELLWVVEFGLTCLS